MIRRPDRRSHWVTSSTSLHLNRVIWHSRIYEVFGIGHVMSRYVKIDLIEYLTYLDYEEKNTSIRKPLHLKSLTNFLAQYNYGIIIMVKNEPTWYQRRDS